MKLSYGISNALPWLLMTVIIIGVAMLEEFKMRRQQGEKYEAYLNRTPFLFPVPRFIARIFSAPLRLFFGKWRPERKREIVILLTFYTVVCIGISAFYSGLLSFPTKQAAPKMEQLVKVVAESPHWGEKRTAAAALADIGEPAVDAMISLLGSEDYHVRWYVANELGGVKSEKVVQALIDLLYDEERNVRSAAAYALGNIGSERAVVPLIEALYDVERNISVSAARALGQIGNPQAVESLIKVLRDSTLNIIGPAAEALGNIGSPEAIEPLISILEQNKNCPYAEVGWALWKLGSERATNAFITGLKTEEQWYRRGACASALGEIQSEVGVEHLIETLKNDENSQVRRSAMLALMKIKSEQSIDALGEALKDKDFEIRMYAEETLKTIGTPRALQVLKQNK